MCRQPMPMSMIWCGRLVLSRIHPLRMVYGNLSTGTGNITKYKVRFTVQGVRLKVSGWIQVHHEPPYTMNREPSYCFMTSRVPLMMPETSMPLFFQRTLLRCMLDKGVAVAEQPYRHSAGGLHRAAAGRRCRIRPFLTLSSMVTTRPVFSAQTQISSLSSGLMKRGLMTAASMPEFHQSFGGSQSRVDPVADRAAAGHRSLPAAVLPCRWPAFQVPVKFDPFARSAGIADGDRTVMMDGGIEHMLQFVLILGCHQDQVGNKAQERKIKDPVMGRSVVADHPAAVQGKGDRQVRAGRHHG